MSQIIVQKIWYLVWVEAQSLLSPWQSHGRTSPSATWGCKCSQLASHRVDLIVSYTPSPFKHTKFDKAEKNSRDNVWTCTIWGTTRNASYKGLDFTYLSTDAIVHQYIQTHGLSRWLLALLALRSRCALLHCSYYTSNSTTTTYEDQGQRSN